MMIRMFGAACAALLILAASAVASPEVAEAQDVGLLGDASLTDADSSSDAVFTKDDAVRENPRVPQAFLSISKKEAETDVEDWIIVVKGSKMATKKRAKKLEDASKEWEDAVAALLEVIAPLEKKYGEFPVRREGEEAREFKTRIEKWKSQLTKDERTKVDEATEKRDDRAENWGRKLEQLRICQENHRRNETDLRKARQRLEDHCNGK
ncbi:MAG: hypothetical protein V3V10_10260 [Planctomycetota bacterium]